MTIKSEKDLAEFLASEEAVETGKVVWLKSGGQAMTVRSVARTKVICEWFDRTGQLRRDDFLIHSLTGRKPLKDGRAAGVLIIGSLEPDLTENKNK